MKPRGDIETTLESESQALEIRLDLPYQNQVTGPLQKHLWLPEKRMKLLRRRERLVTERAEQTELEDRSHPQGVRFQWSCIARQPVPVDYDLQVHAECEFGENIYLTGLTEPHAELVNLRVGTYYSWQVIARLRDQVISQSKIGRFFTNPTPPRWILVPGITNVRDLGGWPLPGGRRVRQGMIFRGSEMNSHCVLTAEGHKVLVEDLAVRTDLDLRGQGEERLPALDPARVKYVNLPLASYDMIAHPEYVARFRELFALLAARSTYPAFIHCWGGADRTGTVAFLLGALLGMRTEDLFTDYELTSLSIWGDRLAGSDAFQDLLRTLEVFAKKGSSLQSQVERYLRFIGVTEGEIVEIREMMTE
ncbi:MAG TPA: tyrosine-protein phosphatase [Anaerolineaceae bacterium]